MKRKRIIKKYIFLTITFVIIVNLLACGPATGTAEWHAEQAYKLINQDRYDEAIEQCNRAIDMPP